MGVFIGYGMRRLLDAQQRYVRNAAPVYIRLRNFPAIDDQPFAQFGFIAAPTGGPAGTTDIEIRPRPAQQMVSMHNIGMSMGKLRLGARIFSVSANFVTHLCRQMNISNEEAFWRDPSFVGIVCNDQLFSVEEPKHEEYGGIVALWMITCNSVETK